MSSVCPLQTSKHTYTNTQKHTCALKNICRACIIKFLSRYLFHLTGIGNCSETDYVAAFAKFAVERGYRIAVYNHVGALRNVPITGNRIFTYGKCKYS